MLRLRRIALLIETSWSYGRGLLRGIGSYARLRGNWVLSHGERGLEEAPPQWLTSWRGDGVIARIETDELAEAVVQLGLPTVDLSGSHDLPGVVSMITDPVATAELAVEHLIECGFDNLAFCGYPRIPFSDARCAAFLEAAARHDRSAAEYEPRRRDRDDTLTLAREVQIGEHDRALPRWLARLPRPVGIMACNDERGRQVLRACRGAELDVPEQIAVIGVDNDEVDCELANPSLSSVAPTTLDIGFRAAALVDRMIDGEPTREGVQYITPSHVEQRRSTDVVVASDPHVAAALRFIRGHVCEGVNVEDVLSSVMISRSTLERRFAEAVGRSPKDHITHVRLSHVKRLLRETDLALPAIAEHTGFKTYAHLSRVFRKATGQTPGKYRHRR